MKVRNSLKSLRGRHRNNRIVRRKGRRLHHQQDQPPLQGASGLNAKPAAGLGRAHPFHRRIFALAGGEIKLRPCARDSSQALFAAVLAAALCRAAPPRTPRRVGGAAEEAAHVAARRSDAQSRFPVRRAQGRARRRHRQGDRGAHLGAVDGLAQRHRQPADDARADRDRGQGSRSRDQAARRHRQDQAGLRRSLEPARHHLLHEEGLRPRARRHPRGAASASRAISARCRASA